MNNVNHNIYQKYKRIMKYDKTVLDEINDLDEAKYLIRMIVNSFYSPIKYRWHNLMKNPDDLPHKYKEVIVFVKERHFSRTYYMVSYLDNDRFLVPVGDKVLGWKHIELFDEKYNTTLKHK